MQTFYLGLYQVWFKVFDESAKELGSVNAIIQAGHSQNCEKVFRQYNPGIKENWRIQVAELVHIGHGIGETQHSQYCLMVKVDSWASTELKGAIR